MTSPVLALLALLLAGPVPWLLGRLPRLRRTPGAAVVLWQSVALAAVLAALGAAVSLATEQGLGDRPAWARLVALLALAVTALVLVRLLLSGHRVGTRLRATRRRHRELVDVLGAVSPGELRVLEAEPPMAWCVPGVRGSRVVLTTSAMDRLGPEELAAVLAHERAHLRARHDLVLEGFTVLHQAFPAVLSSARAVDEIRLLVEVLADRAARAACGIGPVVRALATLGDAPAPDAALGAAPGLVPARLAVLLDERRRPGQAALLHLIAIAVLALPTALVVLPWLRSLPGTLG